MSNNRVSQFSRYRNAKLFSWTVWGLILILNAPVFALAKEKGTKARIDRLEEQADDTRDQIEKEKKKLERAEKEFKEVNNGGNDGKYAPDNCDQPCRGTACQVMRSKDKANISGSASVGGDACTAIWRWARGDQFKIDGRCWPQVEACGTVAKERDLKVAKQARDEAQEKVDALTAEAQSLDRRADKLREDCKDCNRAGGGLYGGVYGYEDREPTTGESIVAGLSAITPMVLGGLSTYQYSKGIKNYYGAYNNMLKQCTTIGVPCSPPGYGVGGGLFGNLGGGIGYGGIGGIGIGGIGMGGLGAIGGIGGVAVGGFAAIGGLGGIGGGGIGIGGVPVGGLYGGNMLGGYGIAGMPYGYGMATPMLPGYGMGGLGGIGGIGGVAVGGFAAIGGLGGMGGLGMGYDPYGMGGLGGLGGMGYGGLPIGYGGIGMGGFPGGIGYGGLPIGYGGVGMGGLPGGIGMGGFPGGIGYGGLPTGIGYGGIGGGYGPYMPGGVPGAYSGLGGGAYGIPGSGGYMGGYNPQYGMLQQSSLQSSMLQMGRAQQGQQDLMIGAQAAQEAQNRYYQTLMQVQSFGGFGGRTF